MRVIGPDRAAADSAKRQQPIGNDQVVLLWRVLEAVDKAFFGCQPGDEIEVGFTGLNAEFADVMLAEALDSKAVDALALQHQFNNLRHSLVLEDAPVRTQPGAGQLRLYQRVVVGTKPAGFALAETADQAVHMA